MIDHLSFSSLALFTNDPVAHFNKYVLGIKEQKTNPAALEGTATHEYIKLILKGQSSSIALQAAEKTVKETEGVDWGKTGNVEKSVNNLHKFISAWEEDYIHPSSRLVHVEEYFSDRIAGIRVPLLGYIDAVSEMSDNNFIVTDWKTVRAYEEELKPAHIVQAYFYKWLLERKYARKKVVRAEFVQIKATKNEDGSPRVKPLTLIFADHKEWEVATKQLVKDSLKLMLKNKPTFIPNLRNEYDGRSSWDSYVIKSNQK